MTRWTTDLWEFYVLIRPVFHPADFAIQNTTKNEVIFSQSVKSSLVYLRPCIHCIFGSKSEIDQEDDTRQAATRKMKQKVGKVNWANRHKRWLTSEFADPGRQGPSLPRVCFFFLSHVSLFCLPSAHGDQMEISPPSPCTQHLINKGIIKPLCACVCEQTHASVCRFCLEVVLRVNEYCKWTDGDKRD